MYTATYTATDADGVVVADQTPLETRAGIDSLDVLHHKRRAVLEQLAPLKALHGPFGLWDARRKQMLEALKIRALHSLTQANEKTPEWRIDAEAHADEQYAALLDRAEADKVAYLNLDNELSEIEERIRSREAELYAYAREARLS